MTSSFVLMIWLLLPVLVLSELSKTEVPLDFKEDLRHLLSTLKHVLLEPKPSKAAYGEILTTLDNLKAREEFYVTIRSFTSTKFLWERVHFLNQILRKKIYEPYSAHFSPIFFTPQQTVPILAQILQILPRATEQDKFSYEERRDILGAVNAYRLFKEARKLVDRKLTNAEGELFVVIERLLLLGFHHIADDPILGPLSMGEEPVPKDYKLDAGRELSSVAVDGFVNKMTKPEKDLVQVIGGISIVSLENRCMVFSKVGKWYLLSYPCK